MLVGSRIVMEDVKVGDRLTIHCYKHNGKIDRISDEAVVLDVTDEMLVCANDHTRLTESDGRSHRTKETAMDSKVTRKSVKSFSSNPIDAPTARSTPLDRATADWISPALSFAVSPVILLIRSPDGHFE